MKKAFKIIGILVLILIVGLIAAPFLFKGTFKDKIRYLANEHVNAKVDFEDVGISIFSSFPKASVTIDGFSVINKIPFEGDTLVYSERISLEMSIKEFFKDETESISVEEIVIDKATIKIQVDSLGKANYDIAKETSSTPKKSSESNNAGFTFDLNHYEINDSKILYHDKTSKTFLSLTDLNHSGNGSVSGDKTILDTKSAAAVSFELDETNYLNKNSLNLDAQLELDLKNQRYTFLKNEAKINQLPLAFDGFVQLNENNTEVDVSFKTPSSDFKNFLAVIPQTYAKNLDGVTTSGDFTLSGFVKGKVDDTYIPKMDVKIASHNASFKYPDLPKGVKNITIDAAVKNETGIVEDTYINIGNLTFKIDEDIFAAKGSFKKLTENMIVDLALKGALNLANLNKAYPLELEQDLNGIVKADVTTNFDMQSLEKEQYQNVKSTGTISLNDFKYDSPEIPNELKIATAKVDFTPGTITLDKMQAETGKSDLTAEGKIENFMGFLFAKQDLKGVFDVSSDTFAVSDFMVAGEETTTNESTEVDTPEEGLKIPSFLDATLNFKANNVIYDNLNLKNTKGSVKIKDETASLQNVTSNIFDGGIAFNGDVSTKNDTPTFGMNLDLSKIDIVKSFSNLELLKGLAPIARALTGALTTEIKLNGSLNDDLTPKLTSLKGNALAQILNAQVTTTQTPLLSKLDSQLNFINLDKLSLNNIKTVLNFNDGKINVKPFNFKVKDIAITAGGSHGFDQNMNYDVSMDIPAKYLGKETGGLISKLSAQETSSMKVAVPLGISGTFDNPKVNLNMKSAIQGLTQQIIAKQKDKAKDAIVDKGKDLLGDLLGNNKTKDSTDVNTEEEKTTTEDKVKDVAKDVLGGLFGKKKKSKDSTKTGN